MKTLIWLDDIRDPLTGGWLRNYAPRFMDNKENVVWVKNYREFTSWINDNGLPFMIAFDHDLENFHINKSTFKEYTGMTCAKWLVDYCMDNNKELPEWTVQSSNPAGKENINGLLNNYLQKHELPT